MDTKIIELREAAKAFPSTSRDVQLSAKSEVLRLSELIDAELSSLRAAVAERDAVIARAVADERESCAKIVSDYAIDMLPFSTEPDSMTMDMAIVKRDNQIAAAIRARGERKE